jgi:hypothetical protein
MAAIIGSMRITYGLEDAKPLRGFPSGLIRIRQRADNFTRAFVKTESGIRHFYVEEVEGFWQPCFEQGRNFRP